MNAAQITAQFSSIDEMAEKTGFALDFCQLESGKPTLKTKTTILPAIVSTQFYFDKSFHQQGMAPDNFLTFGIANKDSDLRWSGKDAVKNCLFDFNARSGFDLSSKGQFLGKSIHVNTDTFYTISDVYGFDLPSFAETDFAAPRFTDPAKLSRLQEAIGKAENLVSVLGTMPEGEAGIAAVEDTLYRSLIDCLAISNRESSQPIANRFAISGRAIEYIRIHYCETITVTDICRACPTTSRTLERVFREEYGVTPKQYLTLVRLSSAHKELNRNNQEKSIRDIAISNGFWHLSQFTQDYKKQYGELPSQTLQQQHITPDPYSE